MPPTPDLLLARLAEIGRSLEHSGQALALIGLGSVGLERARLDEYSDLDFFAIVQPGRKAAFIDDLGWLSAVHPIAYAFRNTADGYKLLYADGVFCEFAVFEPAELAQAEFAEGRVVWKAPGVDEAICKPNRPPTPLTASDPAWLLGEALTNLYVGLGRYRRGEKLTALRFVQVYAVDHLIKLAPHLEPEQPTYRDPYNRERRFEQRFPGLAGRLASFQQGYAQTPESALAILAFLEEHFPVNAALKQAILALAQG
jgi:hypothetical protein